MHCPKCQHLKNTHNDVCSSCGIVFAKYENYLKEKEKLLSKKNKPSYNWKALLIPEQQHKSLFEISLKTMFTILVFIYSVMLIFSGLDMINGTDRIIHLPNLIFHEAGHVIFGFFGQFIGSLGGTLAQLIIPLLCFHQFLIKQRDIFSATIMFWWFGENFLDIAPYVNDARAGVMPLLGGNTGQTAPYGFHDWQYLLTETGLINFDHIIAWTLHILGSAIMIASLVWSIWTVRQQYRN
jgi:hypothetical protein